jgi:hypothetical protein
MEDTSLCNACSHKGNRITKSLAYTSTICPVLEYGAAFWDPCREHINALDQVKMKAAQFTDHTKDSDCQTLAQHSTIACLCALLKTYSGEQGWKAKHNTF